MDNSLIKNVIVKIHTNLEINLDDFINYFGGQLTKKLPAVRYQFYLDMKRFSILIYRTGKVVLTNITTSMFQIIFDFMVDFFLFLFFKKIAKFSDWKTFGNENVYSKENKIYIEFLIENIHFSLNPGIHSININDDFINYIINNLNTINNNFIVTVEDNFIAKFPAKIIKFEFKRQNLKCFDSYKSEASKKRHKKNGNYEKQIISLHVFKQGKLIITGCQLKSDFTNICFLINLLIQNFFKHE